MAWMQWLPHEIAALGTATDAEVADRLKRTPEAVTGMRKKLGIAAVKDQQWKAWSNEELAMLGTMSDDAVAAALGRTLKSVRAQRYARKIPQGRRKPLKDERWEQAIRDTAHLPRLDAARKLKTHVVYVDQLRKRYGLTNDKAVFGRRPWTDEELAMLGTDHDDQIAKKIGRTTLAVRAKRREKGITASDIGRRSGGPQLSLEESERTRTLFEGGASIEEMSNALGIGTAAVYLRLRNMGCRLPKKRMTIPYSMLEKLLMMRANGTPYQEIADELGCSKQAVYQRLHREEKRKGASGNEQSNRQEDLPPLPEAAEISLFRSADRNRDSPAFQKAIPPRSGLQECVVIK